MLTGQRDSCSSQYISNKAVIPLLNDVYFDHEGKNSNILNGGFLNDHSEPLGEVFHMPLGMLALWHLFTEVYRLGLTARYQTALNKLYL